MKRTGDRTSRRSGPGLTFLIVTVLLCALPGARPQAAAPTLRSAAPNGPPARAPQPFEENRGQSGPATGFLTRGAGYLARLDRDGIDLLFPVTSAPGAPRGLRLDFLAGRARTAAGIEKLPGVVNYLAGDDASRSITGVPTFAAIRYTDLYNDIDLTVRGDHRRLALDFAIAAGADARAIVLDLDGAGLHAIDRDDAASDVVLAMGPARLRFAPPTGSRLVFDGRRISVRTDSGDVEGDRVLHLTLERIDDPAPEVDARVATDDAGNLYLAGRTAALSFRHSDAAADDALDLAEAADRFVTRLDRDAITPRYTAYLEGTGREPLHGLAVSAGHEVTLTGRAPSHAGDDRGFVARLAPAGDRVTVTDVERSTANAAEETDRPTRLRTALESAGRAGIARTGGEFTDIAFDRDGRPVVAGFARTGGWRTGRLVQPAPAGGLLFADVLGDAAPAPAAAGCPGTIQFDNSAGTGAWQTATNWDLDRLPDSTDDVCIPAGFTVSNGAATPPINTIYVNAGAGLTVEDHGSLSINADSIVDGTLTQECGTACSISGAGKLTLNTPFLWRGGVMTGVGITDALAGVVISGAAVHDLDASRVLKTAGTTTWLAAFANQATIRLGPGATIQNSGTWDVQGDQPMMFLSGTTSSFENLPGATFKRTTSSGTTIIRIPFNNAGTVDVQTGTLVLKGGGMGTGIYQGAPGATLQFDGGTFTLTSASSVAGATLSLSQGLIAVGGSFAPSNLNLSAGTLALNSGEAIVLDSLTQTGGTLQGGDNITVEGNGVWSGGTKGSTATENYNGSLLLSTSTTKDLDFGRILNINGSVTWSAGAIRLGHNAIIHNFGTWTTTGGSSMTNALGGPARFQNHSGAIFRKALGGSATTTLDTVFDNHGTVEIQSGTLSLTGSGSSDGAITGAGGVLAIGGSLAYVIETGGSVSTSLLQVTAGTLLVNGSVNVGSSTSVTGGTATFNPEATLNSLGTHLGLTGGTLNLDSGEPINLSALFMSAGTLQGSDTLTVSTSAAWSGGTMGGSGTTNANSGIVFTGAATKDVVGSRTLNTAGTTTWSGTVRIGGSASIHNSGLWDGLDGALLSPINPTTGSFENQSGATLRKSAGTGTSTIGVPFTNAGTVRAQTGTLGFTGGYVQTAGLTSAEGGALGASSPLDIQGGTVGGNSTIGAGLLNGGHLAPGLSPGSLAITGSLTQTSGSTFDVEIGGTTPGTQHDRAVVGGAVALAGTLNVTLVNGYSPADQDLFTIMTFPSATGEFDSLSLPPIGGGLSWKYHHNAGSIVLEVFADLDGDGVGNALDCLPGDATVWSIPEEIAGVVIDFDTQTIAWDSLAAQSGPATLYDVMRGDLSELPAGGGASETCVSSDTATVSITDATTPALGTGFYYLVRGGNACGIGSYGNQSNGTPRSTPACP